MPGRAPRDFRNAKRHSAELTPEPPAVSSDHAPSHAGIRRPGKPQAREASNEGRRMSLDSLSREQLVEAVRRFVRERLVPQERAVAEDDAIPEDIVEEMRGLGLFGLSTPPEYGGLGLDHGRRDAYRLRARPDLAGLPLALRHQYRHRLAGHRHRRHRGAEAQLPAAPGLRRDHRLLLPDRAGERLGCREPHAPARGARASTIC